MCVYVEEEAAGVFLAFFLSPSSLCFSIFLMYSAISSASRNCTHHRAHITHHSYTHHTSHVTHHMSHITEHTSQLHTSHITCHTSRNTHHTSPVTHHNLHKYISHLPQVSHILLHTHHTHHMMHHMCIAYTCRCTSLVQPQTTCIM